MGQQRYYFRTDSAGGLVPNSAVKMAGIKVGTIREIVLEDGRARIVIGLDSAARVTQGTLVELKADGILGDRHVELFPGPQSAPLIPSGSELQLSGNKSGMDDLMTEVSKVAKAMGELMTTLNRATKEGDDSTRLGRIVQNIEDITADLKDVTGTNKDKLNEIMERIRSISANVDDYINDESLARVAQSIKNVEEISGKINKGQGTLGKLVNDETTIDEINAAVSNINQFLGQAQTLETSVDFHSEFMLQDRNKSFLGFRLQPGLDRYYELIVISDSRGVTREENISQTTDGVNSNTSFRKTYRNEFKITGLFAKNFWDFSLKGGIIESTGGVALDYYVAGNRNIRFSAEFFNFNQMQIRAFLRYNFFKGMYMVVGGDNLLGRGDFQASGFAGAGIFLTNDDLKFLASRVTF
jgi:phospholipid/cholesterol/gamma-HCH transport system substrate-binding protein